jgi:hypothetical protein
MSFIRDHFDKFLLAGLFLIMVGIVLILALKGEPPETIAWARELTGTFSGALIGLITGVAIGKRMGETSAPPVETNNQNK